MGTEWKKIGEIGVDAGLCWIGDPCYCVTPDADEHPAKSWSEFCDMLDGVKNPIAKQFHYKMGHSGLGVCVTSGHGDGVYDIFVRYTDEGSISEMKVVFIDDKNN